MKPASSRTWFWVAQVGGWGAYASSLFLTFLPAMEPGRRVAVLINKELRAVVGIAISLGLLRLYRRVVPEPEVTPRLAVITVIASIVAGVAGYFAHAAIMVGIGLQPSFDIFLDPTSAPRSILEFVFAFLVPQRDCQAGAPPRGKPFVRGRSLMFPRFSAPLDALFRLTPLQRHDS